MVTITANKEMKDVSGWTLSSDKKSMTKNYKANTSEKVIVTDLAGNELTLTIAITNIEKWKKGDANKDNKITATDLILIKKKLVGLEMIIKEEMDILDLNEDGKVTATDLLLLKKKIVGLI